MGKEGRGSGQPPSCGDERARVRALSLCCRSRGDTLCGGAGQPPAAEADEAGDSWRRWYRSGDGVERGALPVSVCPPSGRRGLWASLPRRSDPRGRRGGEACAAGRRAFVPPACRATDSGDWPQLAYVFPAPLDALCLNWMGGSADRGWHVRAAGAEGRERKSRPSRQIALSTSPGSLRGSAGDANRGTLLCSVLSLVVSSKVARAYRNFGKGGEACEI